MDYETEIQYLKEQIEKYETLIRNTITTRNSGHEEQYWSYVFNLNRAKDRRRTLIDQERRAAHFREPFEKLLERDLERLKGVKTL